VYGIPDKGSGAIHLKAVTRDGQLLSAGGFIVVKRCVLLFCVVLVSALMMAALTVHAAEPVWELTFEDESDLSWLRVANADTSPLPAAEHAELSISDEVGGHESRHALKITRKNNEGAYIM